MLHDIKILMRSGPWSFTRSAYTNPETRSSKLSIFRWNKHPVYYRAHTSDRGIIYNILIQKGKKAEYYVPDEISPNVIFDIGGNIGITAIWLAEKYPAARIYSFEPVAENFEILKKNVEPYSNINAYNFGLGESTCTLDMFANEDSTNQGGFSLFFIWQMMVMTLALQKKPLRRSTSKAQMSLYRSRTSVLLVF